MQRISAIFTFLTILVSTGFAQDLDVGLYRKKKISRIVFSYHQGSYNVYGDSTKLWTILPNESIELRYRSEGVQVLHGAEELGFYKSIRLEQNNTNSSVRIKSTSPNLKERKQQDNFVIRK